MHKAAITLVLLIITLFAYDFYLARIKEKQFIVTGTGNPGLIKLFEVKGASIKLIKTIDSGYKFVHTVRLGDVYNNGNKQIIAGISNSFFAQPYGCQVVAYDLTTYEKSLIDNVGDLRCKDLTIGDADNDGKNELLLATHGQGILRMYKWQNDNWTIEDIEKNLIAQIDLKEQTNHRVSNDELTCSNCIVQTAAHIVKVGDVDNDGKNEIISTMSSPLELQNQNEISFINIYKKNKGRWQSYLIDRLTNREFRSITIGDIYNSGKNVMVIGIGSPRNEKGSLFAYEYKNDKWDKTIIHNDGEEKNMKGVAIGNIYNNGKKQTLLATGFPDAKIKIFDWNGNGFTVQEIGSISQLFPKSDSEYNSMAAILDLNDKNKNIIIAGTETFPKQKIGWEGSNKGFLIKYTMKNNIRTSMILDRNNLLGMDFN